MYDGYEEYIERIKLNSSFVGSNGVDELYKLENNGKYILIRMRKFPNGSYSTLCRYQRHDEGKLIIPTLWDIGTYEDFFDRFLKDIPTDVEEKWLNFYELKKTKAKRINRKTYEPVWLDSNNRLYISDRPIPKKKEIEEWKLLADNSKSAIFIRYNYHNEVRGKYKWFINREKAEKFIKQDEKIGNWYVVKNGYNHKHPMERNVILKLPYFKIDEELKEHHKDKVVTMLHNSIKNRVEISWVENVVNSYMTYKKMKQKEETKGE